MISRIGRGGMGEVYLAEQQDIGTKVAVKVLRTEISGDDKHVQRLFNEARAASRIQHAGIVKIFDVGRLPSGEAYLIMEHLDGESLARRIQRGRLSLAQICDIGRQIAGILDATHAANITHRDLKPDNIYLVPDRELASKERVKVLDFGIAKLSGTLAGASPGTTGMLGTPAYMAPEQWGDSSKVDYRSDLYSLGCVAFEMCTGRPPFIVQTFAEACAKHLHEPPPSAKARDAAVPDELDRLLLRLLSKDPAARGTMQEAARVFEHVAMSAGSAVEFGPTAATPQFRGNISDAETIPTQAKPAPSSLPTARDRAPDTNPVAAKPPRRFPLWEVLLCIVVAGGVVTGAIYLLRPKPKTTTEITMAAIDMPNDASSETAPVDADLMAMPDAEALLLKQLVDKHDQLDHCLGDKPAKVAVSATAQRAHEISGAWAELEPASNDDCFRQIALGLEGLPKDPPALVTVTYRFEHAGKKKKPSTAGDALDTPRGDTITTTVQKAIAAIDLASCITSPTNAKPFVVLSIGPKGTVQHVEVVTKPDEPKLPSMATPCLERRLKTIVVPSSGTMMTFRFRLPISTWSE